MYVQSDTEAMDPRNPLFERKHMLGKLAVLESHGLIVQKEVPITRAMRIDLTEKGKEVMRHLLEI